MKFRLIQDGDGHWYVIPTGKEDEFYKWCSDMEKDIPCEDPEWLRSVGNPSRVSFDEYQVR